MFEETDIASHVPSLDDKGYLRIYVGFHSHPGHNKGFVFVHRCTVENFIGRFLESSEIIHHIDEVKTNNSIENLFLCSQEEHIAIHNRGRHNSLAKKKSIRNGVQKFNRLKNTKLEKG